MNFLKIKSLLKVKYLMNFGFVGALNRVNVTLL